MTSNRTSASYLCSIPLIERSIEQPLNVRAHSLGRVSASSRSRNRSPAWPNRRNSVVVASSSDEIASSAIDMSAMSDAPAKLGQKDRKQYVIFLSTLYYAD
jgi:hypothetical protein